MHVWKIYAMRDYTSASTSQWRSGQLKTSNFDHDPHTKAHLRTRARTHAPTHALTSSRRCVCRLCKLWYHFRVYLGEDACLRASACMCIWSVTALFSKNGVSLCVVFFPVGRAQSVWLGCRLCNERSACKSSDYACHRIGGNTTRVALLATTTHGCHLPPHPLSSRATRMKRQNCSKTSSGAHFEQVIFRIGNRVG